MKADIKKISGTKIELKIEIPFSRLEEYFERAIFALGKDLEVEGFRKGKAPREIIEKVIAREKILAKASEDCIKESYLKAVEENKIEPISQPEIKIEKMIFGKNLLFKASFQVLPEVKLPDYKKIASEISKNKVLIENEEVEAELLWLQKSRAKFSQKTGPAEKGDFLEIEFSSPQLEGGKVYQDGFILGKGYFVAGFEENLEKMEAGQEKEFSLVFPKDFFRKELVEKKVDFKVKIKSLQKVELPELNDQFAKNLGKFEDLESLRKSIKEGLFLEKEKLENQRLRTEILEKIVAKSDFEVPEILVNREKRRLFEDLKKFVAEKFKIEWSDYLKKTKKTEKELLDSLEPRAQKSISNFLVLEGLGKRENIEVSEKEVEDEINKFLKQYSSTRAQKEIDLEKLKSYTEEVIRNQKILEKLESFSKK